MTTIERKAKLGVLSVLTIAAAMAGAAPAAQAHSEGTRGGGEAQYDDKTGMFALRDVVDPTVCVWKTGDTVIDENPTILSITSAVAKLDWYFAMDLERRIRDHNYCFTQYLVPVDTRDDSRDRLTTDYSYYVDYVQAGIFTEDSIYINREMAAHMTPKDRALLFIHEPFHTYLDWGIPNRNARLRSMVKTIEQVFLGKVTKLSDLYAAMSENQVQFPRSVTELAGQKDYLSFALADAAEAREKLLHTTNLGLLFGLYPLPSADALLADDYQRLLDLHSDPNGTILAPYCESGDREVLEFLASKPEVGKEAVASVCLHDPNAKVADVDFRSWLLSMVDFEAQATAFYDRLMIGEDGTVGGPRVSAQEGRLMVVAGVSDLTGTPADSRLARPITELLALDDLTDKAQVASSARGFIGMLKELIDAGQVDRAIKLTAGNDKFYQAFGIKADLALIQTLPVGIERERAMAADVYTRVFQGFLHEALTELGSDANAPLTKAIDWNRLGYQF